MKKILPMALAAFALAGCASYRWTSPVPSDMRTVCVPTFRNESDVVEIGAVAARQVLREFQREGTFKIAPADEAAIEVQGVVKFASAALIHFKRTVTMRAYEQRLCRRVGRRQAQRQGGRQQPPLCRGDYLLFRHRHCHCAARCVGARGRGSRKADCRRRDVVPLGRHESKGGGKMKKDGVRAVIELRITPQRDCGFGKIAERVAKFEQVEACFLMSGGYDLLVFVKGDSLQDVAQFVAADLSTIDGVLSTATHFMLETYKAGGVFDNPGDGRLEVS